MCSIKVMSKPQTLSNNNHSYFVQGDFFIEYTLHKHLTCMTNLYCYLGSILDATVILITGGELKCNRRH